MKRESPICLFLVLLVPLLLAMGMMGKPPALEKAPETKEQWNARVVDMEGVETEITYVSYDGELYVPVYRGMALVTLPFKEIAKIEFGKKEGSKRKARIFFHHQNPEMFSMDGKVFFVGKLPFGTYQIEARDMESIEFLQPLLEEGKGP